MTPTFAFDNSYATLPERFYARQSPVPVAEPQLLALNAPLAGALGLDAAALASPEGVAMLAGNAVPEGAAPIAQAYAGDQFGQFVPRLGDGRAVLVGEIAAPSGARFDLALKGAGRTPFSRGGDGRAWLGPVLREYLVSEAMAALGIPTTRALAAVATGEPVYRETRLPGAVLARVAASHIRVGTFQYFAARGDTEALGLLADHVIARHHPGAEGAAGLLDAVIGAQARLVAQWLGAGFVHGVMNTDNMTLSGETIDYGPCAFLDGFNPMQSFSAIDTYGRYAYARQPDVAVWNLARLASALLPLMGANEEQAIAQASALVQGFPDRFEAARRAVFGAKIGLAEPRPEDEPLIEGLLGLMAEAGADFTATFRALAEGAPLPLPAGAALDDWHAAHGARLAQQPGGRAAAGEIMRAANPALIARNHQVEAVIAAALGGDMAPFHRLAAALVRPFAPAPEDAPLALPPPPGAAVTRTFCGT